MDWYWFCFCYCLGYFGSCHLYLHISFSLSLSSVCSFVHHSPNIFDLIAYRLHFRDVTCICSLAAYLFTNKSTAYSKPLLGCLDTYLFMFIGILSHNNFHTQYQMQCIKTQYQSIYLSIAPDIGLFYLTGL